MNSRSWVRLFFSTLLLGGTITAITGFAVRFQDYKDLFVELHIRELLSVFVWLVGVGLIFSIISQMGFFAYLTVHRFGLGMFRRLWNSVQILLTGFVLFDLFYFRMQIFQEKGETALSYVWLPMLILIVGLVVAYFKAKSTSKNAFIPALFFMTVVTILEWMPVLRINEKDWLYLMLFPLLGCNAYQMLVLHKMNQTKALNKTIVA